MLTVPGEVVNGIGGHRLGCIPPAGTWIGQCHRKSPPPWCGPSSEPSSWGLAPPICNFRRSSTARASPNSLLAPPVRLTPQYRQGSPGYKSSSCSWARGRTNLELRLGDRLRRNLTVATNTNRTAVPKARRWQAEQQRLEVCAVRRNQISLHHRRGNKLLVPFFFGNKEPLLEHCVTRGSGVRKFQRCRRRCIGTTPPSVSDVQ